MCSTLASPKRTHYRRANWDRAITQNYQSISVKAQWWETLAINKTSLDFSWSTAKPTKCKRALPSKKRNQWSKVETHRMLAKRKCPMWIGMANFWKVHMKVPSLSSKEQLYLLFGPFGNETAVNCAERKNKKVLKEPKEYLAFAYTNQKVWEWQWVTCSASKRGN